MKVWLDDIRLPPDGWTWARRATGPAPLSPRGAIELLKTEEVTAISLDFDLGSYQDDPYAYRAPYFSYAGTQTGMEVVNFMIEQYLVPPDVRIHSWNRGGAVQMQRALQEVGFTAPIEPWIDPSPDVTDHLVPVGNGIYAPWDIVQHSYDD